MKGIEQGFLLLTSHLGDPACKPLTVAQFRTLAKRAALLVKPIEDRSLTVQDLIKLGYDGKEGERILFLLSRKEQLKYYVNLGARQGCYPITRISEEYPAILRKRMGLDAPACLWVKGKLSDLSLPAVSLVGSRQLRKPNEGFAQAVGEAAAQQGFVLISGNAHGADQTAQRSCLQNGGQVISVVADRLSDQAEEERILYVSEDGFDLPFSAQRALSRNRIIHGWGTRTFVAQCSYESGGSWKGTVHNLRNQLSKVYCFDDGSQSVSALTEMGAEKISRSDLRDISALPMAEKNLFDTL